MGYNKRWLWLIVAIIVLDQCAKYWVLASIPLGQVKTLLPVFNIATAFNPGAAFSFLGDASGWQRYALSGLAIVVSATLIILLLREQFATRWRLLGFSAIAGGAIGNVIDRIQYGYVIDFFQCHIATWYFPTFNIADTAITVGVIALLIDMLCDVA